MARYLLKHYRGGPAPVVDIDPMDQWSPAEVDAHIEWMRDFATRLKETGEYVNEQALSPEGTFVRYGGDRLGADRGVVRRARPSHGQPRRPSEPCRRSG